MNVRIRDYSLEVQKPQLFQTVTSIHTAIPVHVLKVLQLLELAGMFNPTDTLEMNPGYSTGASVIHPSVFFEVQLPGIENTGQVSITGDWLTVTNLEYDYLKLDIISADRDDELEEAVEKFLELLRKVYGGLPVIFS
jgi:hypothetical protein